MERFVSIHLSRSLEKPLYLQIFEGILTMIRDGQLEPGEKLPPIRKLSSLIEVNSSTVVSAYKLLEKRGFVVSRVGSGTYVSPAPMSSDASIFTNEADNELQSSYNFAGTAMSPVFFPVKEFKEVLNEALDRDGGYAFGYQEATGYPPLRQAIGEVILSKYGVDAHLETLQIVSGAQQGIDIIAKAMLEFNDTVLVESPTYTGAIDAFKAYGAKVVEIPMEKDGADLKALRSLLHHGKSPKLFYSMPNFHNPTGYSYSEEKRRELLDLASEYDFYILEDDHINDLFYQDRPDLLKSLDKEDRVFYVKSFSKPFMPGIRLAFMLPPKAFSEKIAYVKYATDIFSSGLFQRSMELFLMRGYWEKNVRRIREIFGQRRALMKEALKKHLPPQVQYNSPQGGLFFWLTLPQGLYSMNLYHEALKEGVLLVPGDLFFPDRRPSSSFRLSIAEIEPHRIGEGIRLLSKSIKNLMEQPSLPNIGSRPIL